jgi:hypothetical protein
LSVTESVRFDVNVTESITRRGRRSACVGRWCARRSARRGRWCARRSAHCGCRSARCCAADAILLVLDAGVLVLEAVLLVADVVVDAVVLVVGSSRPCAPRTTVHQGTQRPPRAGPMSLREDVTPRPSHEKIVSLLGPRCHHDPRPGRALGFISSISSQSISGATGSRSRDSGASTRPRCTPRTTRTLCTGNQ